MIVLSRNTVKYTNSQRQKRLGKINNFWSTYKYMTQIIGFSIIIDYNIIYITDTNSFFLINLLYVAVKGATTISASCINL